MITIFFKCDNLFISSVSTSLEECDIRSNILWIIGSCVLPLIFPIISFESYLNSVAFLSGLMPSVLADRLGRRPLLIYSYLGVAISLVVVGIYFFLLEVIGLSIEVLSPFGFITLTGIICSNIISTIGFQSIVQVVAGEIFPLNVKAVAMTALSIFGGLLSFVVARGYQFLQDYLGLCGVFWIFASIALFGALFSLIYIPETKGKSLREIQELLQGELYNDDEVTVQGLVRNDAGENDKVVELKELKKHEAA